jgi:membrane protein YdbS with pleckstrin-like domain
MSGAVDRASRWIYRGVWGALVDVFRVPDRPPTLPGRFGTPVRTFQPSEGFLRWLKFHFWLILALIDGAILAGWILIYVNSPTWGYILALPAALIAIVPDIFAYIAIHLRFDTTWYVMSERSIRIRRGIWVINEVSITFENVQNVRVSQGPLQRFFGVADVVIETAGAGGGGESGGAANQGRIEGVSDAPAIRDQVMGYVRQSRSAGLGDEQSERLLSPGWTPAHIEALREIRDLIKAG